MADDMGNDDMERWQELLNKHQTNNDWTNTEELCRELNNAHVKASKRLMVLNKRLNVFARLYKNYEACESFRDEISKKLTSVGIQLLRVQDKCMEIEDHRMDHCNYHAD